MKNISLLLIIFLCAWGGSSSMNAQQIIKKSGYYYFVKDSVSDLITSKDAHALLLSETRSKTLYQDSRNLQKLAWISLAASTPFFIYHHFANIETTFFSFAGSATPSVKNNTPLIIGSACVGLYILAGTSSWITYHKSIDVYNHPSGKAKPEDHSLNINAAPGGVSLTYQF